MDKPSNYVECRDHLDQRARKDFVAILDSREHLDQKENEENADQWVHLDSLVQKVIVES